MSPTGLRRLFLAGALAAAAGLGACVAYPGNYGYGNYAYNNYGYGYGYSQPSYSYPSRYSYPRSYSYPRYYSSSRRYYDNDRRSYRRSTYSRRDDGWRDGNRRYVRRHDGDGRRYDRGWSRGASRNPYYFYRPGHENDR